MIYIYFKSCRKYQIAYMYINVFKNFNRKKSVTLFISLLINTMIVQFRSCAQFWVINEEVYDLHFNLWLDWVNILLKCRPTSSSKVSPKRNFTEDYLLPEPAGTGENCCFIVRCSHMTREVMAWCASSGDNSRDKKLLSLSYHSTERNNVSLYGV